jgi:hypothetical protein
MSVATILLSSFWMAMSVPLISSQYNALMDVYGGLGGAFLLLGPLSCSIFFLQFFVFRMQRDHMRTIRFIGELC